MAVKATLKDDGKLNLAIDNGDLIKMKEVIEKWKFKDEQSFWRFSLSILLEAQDNELWIKSDGKTIQIQPVDILLKMEKLEDFCGI